MIEVQDLVVRYGSGHDAFSAVDRVSFDVPKGGTLGLVGESGSGKSTIARALIGLLPVAGGSISLDGADVTRHKDRNSLKFRRRVQMVFQDPFASLNPRMTIGNSLDDALRNVEGLKSSRDRRTEAARALDLVGVAESALDRYPHQFSGGQRQRIAIARALAVRPDVVIMDEVTSALDVSVQATVLNLLKRLQRELELSYVFISHDLSVVGTMSDKVAVMYRGRIVELEETSELFDQARHPYTRALIASVPHLGSEKVTAPLSGDLPDPRQKIDGCPFHTRCPVGPKARPEQTICLTDDPLLVADTKPHHSACHFADSAQIIDLIPTNVGRAVVPGQDSSLSRPDAAGELTTRSL